MTWTLRLDTCKSCVIWAGLSCEMNQEKMPLPQSEPWAAYHLCWTLKKPCASCEDWKWIHIHLGTMQCSWEDLKLTQISILCCWASVVFKGAEGWVTERNKKVTQKFSCILEMQSFWILERLLINTSQAKSKFFSSFLQKIAKINML